jgi:hypothetical protein
MMKKSFFALFLVLASNAMAATGDPCGNGYAYVANADGYCCRKVAASSPTSSACVPPSQVVTVVSSYNTMFGRDQKACCTAGSSFQILPAAESGKCKENGGLEFLVNGKPYCCAKGSRI